MTRDVAVGIYASGGASKRGCVGAGLCFGWPMGGTETAGVAWASSYGLDPVAMVEAGRPRVPCDSLLVAVVPPVCVLVLYAL